jgi:hypothetical protein
MQDSVLKKQFAEKDIQRIRNLVKGKNEIESPTV